MADFCTARYTETSTSPTDHSTIQRSGEYDDNLFQTGHNNPHRPYRTRVHGWLLLPIPMTGVRLTLLFPA